MLEFLAAAGFAPQQVASSEIYQALSTGVIDGAHWGAAAGALSLKLWEVAPFHMKPSLQLTNNCYMVNQAAREILAKEMAKGPKAKEFGDRLLKFMGDLGYA